MTYIPITNDARIKQIGSSTLSAGTVVVATVLATTTAKIYITPRAGVVNLGSVSVSAISSGVSFTLLSTNVLDNRVIDYIIFEP